MLDQVIVPVRGGGASFPGIVVTRVQLSVSDGRSKKHDVVDVLVKGAPESGVTDVTLE
jgi:hypothetical protein